MTRHVSLRIILDEHRALAAMLRSLPLLLKQYRDNSGAKPDWALLRAMLFYVDEFPEQRHHRKESELLFPKLRARSPLARELLDELDADHASGERRIRHLQHLLLGWEMMGGEPRRAAFEQAADDYVRFYLKHMAEEERVVLPLAQQVLSDSDWAELDEAFLANRDALAGSPPDPVYAQFFSRIVQLAPAPVGLGPAL